MKTSIHIMTATLLLATILPTLAAAGKPKPPCKPDPPVSAFSFVLHLTEANLSSRGPGPDYARVRLSCEATAFMERITCTAAPDDPLLTTTGMRFECAESGARGPEVVSTGPDNCTLGECGQVVCILTPDDFTATTCGHPAHTLDTLSELLGGINDGEVSVIAVGPAGPVAAGTIRVRIDQLLSPADIF